MARLTLVVVGETLFGADLEPEADEIADAMRVSLDTFNLFVIPAAGALERIPLPAMRRFRKAQRCLDRTVARLLDERRAGDRRDGDLLPVLPAAADEGDWPEHQARDEAMTILLAGHETTATALTWTWYLLARHPEVEAELERELRRLPPGRLPAAEDTPSLRYTEMVVREAIRLCPPAWLIGRRALVDYELDRYTIRKGSIVIVSPYVTHHDAALLPRALRLPPRALDGRGAAEAPALRLPPVRRRPARLHRRGVRMDGGDPRPRNARARVEARVGARSRGAPRAASRFARRAASR